MFVATALKSKAIALLLTGAVVGGGTIASVTVLRHYGDAAVVASVPTPAAPPSETLTPIAGPAASPAPQPAYTPQPSLTPAPAPIVHVVAAPFALLNDQQLDQLLAPIALYPDPLIAEMLPAATYPDELASATIWLRYNANPSQFAIDAQPWEPSIKGLVHSPSVLAWMYNNADWTRTVGTAFTYQSQDVMESIQRLRAQAIAAGALIDTPQQVVIYQASRICIEPANPEIIYVPVYDWRVVYVRGYHPALTFFVGCNVGTWLDFDCDWDDHFVVFGARWDRGWDHRWDHDSRARPVTVRTNNTTIINNHTNITNNNTNVSGATRTVNTGGTQWTRNDAKPAPTLPPTVKPAGKSTGGVAPAERTMAPPMPAAPPDRGVSREAGRAPAPTPTPSPRGADRGTDRGSDRGNSGSGRDRGRGRNPD